LSSGLQSPFSVGENGVNGAADDFAI